jgi:hypothetical protein
MQITYGWVAWRQDWNRQYWALNHHEHAQEKKPRILHTPNDKMYETLTHKIAIVLYYGGAHTSVSWDFSGEITIRQKMNTGSLLLRGHCSRRTREAVNHRGAHKGVKDRKGVQLYLNVT